MEFFANLIGGGLLGAVSSIFNGWLKHVDQKDKRRHQLALIKANSDAAVREIEARIKIQHEITEGNIQEAEMRAEENEMHGRNAMIEKLTGRYASENILEKMMDDNSLLGKIFRPFIYLHVLVMDFLRGIIRPLVTSGSIVFAFYVFVTAFDMYQKMNGTIAPSDLMDSVIKPIINLLIFIVSVVIGFWFADKSASRRFQVQMKTEK